MVCGEGITPLTCRLVGTDIAILNESYGQNLCLMLEQIRKLVLGNGLAQAIQLLSLLALSRLYTPGDFGLLAQVQAAATVLAIVFTLQLHLAIPLSNSVTEARALTVYTQSCVVMVALTLLIPAYLTGRLGSYSLCLTLVVALINTYTGYLIYRGDFSFISRLYVLRAALIVTFQLIFAFLSVQDGLVLATLFAETLSALILLKFGLDHQPPLRLQPSDLLDTVRRYKAFTFYGTIQELVSAAAFYAPLVLFSIYFDNAEAGQYAMASRLVWAPTTLISRNIAQVLYHQHKSLEARIKTTTVIQFFKSKYFVFVCLTNVGVFYLSTIFSILLGDQWLTASEAIPFLVVWCSAFILSTPFRVLCRSLNLQKVQLLIDLFFFVAIAAIFNEPDLDSIHIIYFICLLGIAQNLSIVIAVDLNVKKRV
jgi:O-antigen/teichoic acid export membrane protein